MLENFSGNPLVVAALRQMIEGERIPHTLLFHGPEGIGKATLARRLGAALLGDADKIEKDDLSLPHNAEMLAEREKLASDQRAQDPLLLASHPDFNTFPPDGPLRQISIQQMRLLKERAQYKPLRGRFRLFLIDQVDRANEQAANSLLKTLEEPPDHLVLVLTAGNAYNLLPTIRSRSVPFYLAPLSPGEMQSFARERGLDHPERRIALAGGSPGAAISIDLETFDRRRAAMLSLLAAGAGKASFSDWAPVAEKLAAARSEKLEFYLKPLYMLLEDILRLHAGSDGIANEDIRPDLEKIAVAVTFPWIRNAVHRADELAYLLRRNIQKSLALDALVVGLQAT
ncbi:MAG: DNA polymerase III subunit delta' [Bryobacteraceae bacterium]|nr:DNA polymerase III subunit delta' [Bryobacteraceae bacterium]